VEKSATLSEKSRLGEAFAYVLNQWDALCYYCDDGLVEPDNNAAERALRAVCLGKKNYIFFGSDLGGEHAASKLIVVFKSKRLIQTVDRFRR
jgi:transposase